MWIVSTSTSLLATDFIRLVALASVVLVVSDVNADRDAANVRGNVPHSIQKRDIYVTFQERAQTICIGLCMYHDKRPFVRCERRCRIGEPEPRNRNSRRIGRI